MSDMKIQGGEKTIQDVFGEKYAFEIPHYQRPYSWTVSEADAAAAPSVAESHVRLPATGPAEDRATTRRS